MKARLHKLKTLGRLLGAALKELLQNDPLRLAGATAFFTTFALPPIMVILIQVLKVFLDPALVRGQLFGSLSSLLGPEAVGQLVSILRSMRRLAHNWYVTIGGMIFLLFVATTLFKVIKNSLNQVWKIRPAGRGFLSGLRPRLQAVLVIIVAGVLFVIGLVAEGLQVFIGSYIFELSPLLSFYFNTALSKIISTIMVTLWFAIVFRYLPDGRPRWKLALAGGMLTGILFAIGRVILHWLLSYSNINTLYGTSASIVLLLLFVFYSSLILYYGAAFTSVLGVYWRQRIRPLPHAQYYRITFDSVRHEGEKP